MEAVQFLYGTLKGNLILKMKKLIILIMSLTLSVSLIGCSSNDKHNFYGIYSFEEVSYLSGLSSSTIDYYADKMTGTKYTIEDNLFKIEYAGDDAVEISSPNYTKEEIPGDTDLFSDVRSFIGDEVEYQYTIYTEDGSKTGWRLYVSPENLWIASYVDNTVDGSEIIMDIMMLGSNSPP
jgi:hypothetical protein